MHPMNREVREQIHDAYRQMSDAAHYRPAAPSDGHGNITVPDEDLDLEAECAKYARDWWREEDEQKFTIGCPDFSLRKTLIFCIEAATGLHTGLRADTEPSRTRAQEPG